MYCIDFWLRGGALNKTDFIGLCVNRDRVSCDKSDNWINNLTTNH